MVEIIEVRVNCSSLAEAEQIASKAVQQRLAASCNVHGPVSSTYRWRQTVTSRDEVLLVLKTTDLRFEALAELIETRHSYETPGIVGVRIDHANTAYRDWIISETGSDGE